MTDWSKRSWYRKKPHQVSIAGKQAAPWDWGAVKTAQAEPAEHEPWIRLIPNGSGSVRPAGIFPGGEHPQTLRSWKVSPETGSYPWRTVFCRASVSRGWNCKPAGADKSVTDSNQWTWFCREPLERVSGQTLRDQRPHWCLESTERGISYADRPTGCPQKSRWNAETCHRGYPCGYLTFHQWQDEGIQRLPLYRVPQGTSSAL